MEFKKLSDVEVVAEPIETANVLIEENGVIKKAPKTAVGSGGSDNNIVINIPYNENAEIDVESRDGLPYMVNASCNKTYDEVSQMCANNNIGMGTVNHIMPYGIANMNPIVGLNFSKSGYIIITYMCNGDGEVYTSSFSLYPDGLVKPPM